MEEIRTQPYVFKRFMAAFIDYLIIYGFTFILIFAIGEPNDEGGHSLNGFPALIPIAFWLLMTVGIETVLGATLGNSLFELKPIPQNGVNRKLTFLESLKRHLLDPIDMFPFGLLGIVTIKNTTHNQRVGDLWAKTIVIKEK